ncbi:DUF397 domain-containing protein [Micromonospora sp. WMMA1363]|uniref:DUF397 domain-containing protein n=1 Tax=Micromonospora sp. WMMA1363 TaxID=3053985 RepID=UPI00259CC0CF|nr:DUF397 domain-containing protein [Micromonospora sp. WMMA1363]MDM4723281.1 DUF397 domain-containing protein [Micromonospora sp. WMMA1363]MDM4723375.1 DUF397 domain-containing protein [Micromonospora sp. WMMA1363]
MVKLVRPGELVGARWFKSSRSNNGQGCVEVALNLAGAVYMRDTKDNGEGPILHFTDAGWDAFVGAVKKNNFGK